MTRLVAFLDGLSAERFFGDVRLKYRDGQLVMVRTEQDFKPDTLPLRSGTTAQLQALERETTRAVTALREAEPRRRAHA